MCIDMCVVDDLVEEQVLLAILQNNPNLARLVVSETERFIVTERSLTWIAAQCHSLSQLHLAFAQPIATQLVTALFQNCPNLTYVNLNEFNKTTWRVIVSITQNRKSVTLHEEFPAAVGATTSEEWVSFFSVVTNCTHIKLKFLANFDHNALMAISELSSSLKYLDLIGLDRVTTNDLMKLVTAFHASVFVNCSKCANVDNLKVKLHAEKCRKERVHNTMRA